MAKLTPFDAGGLELDYQALIEQFGTEPIANVKNLPNTFGFQKGFVKDLKDGMLLSHRDFDKFMDDVVHKRKVSILTGFNASGSIHLGHYITFKIVLEMQKKYKLPVFIPISDDESYVTKKIESQEEGLKNAKLIASQLIAMGFDQKLTKIFIHQTYTKIYNLAIKLSTKATLSTVKAVYGFDDSTNAGLMFYPIIQAADILFPQEVLGPHRTLVLIGIDQDPHVRLARDIAEKFGYVKPAALHTKYVPGLKGGKMSKSLEGSAIFFNDKPETAARNVMNALTGGKSTAEEQKRLGADIDKCIVCNYHHYFLEGKELEKVIIDQKIGRSLCGDSKKILAENIKKFLIEFQKKVKIEEKDINKFLMKD
jgi:tryptophanyl-tRNA synthetase